MFSIFKPYIFSLDPEVAHDLAIKSLKANIIPKSFFKVENEEILETKLLGKIISKDNSAYNYLPESVSAFPYGKKLNRIIEKCGYNRAKDHSLTLGIASIYIAEK